MAIQALRELKKTYGPNIVFLMETRNDRETMEKVRKKIKMAVILKFNDSQKPHSLVLKILRIKCKTDLLSFFKFHFSLLTLLLFISVL